jgi:trk system potassium uptake protein TrkA
MRVLVIGCGRVGSNVAKALHRHGWDVTVIDEKEEALSRLGENWPGRFIKGHGMDAGVLHEAGIDGDDPPVAVVVATDGDNTNIVIGQVAQKRFDIPTVVVRLLDPARAEFYAARGLRVVCPTSNAISVLTEAVRSAEVVPRERVPA